MEIGYGLIPSERRKGYCTEVVKVIVDYLFLPKNVVRDALFNVNNVASQKVLEKAGFKKEGVIRKSVFIRGNGETGVCRASLEKNGKNQRY